MSELDGRAEAMRAAFDRGFAEPVVAAAPTVDFLAIGAGDRRCAVALAEIGGVYTDRRITSLPTTAPGLLGLSSFRGTIVPVYDLALLLGDRRGSVTRWIAVAAAAPVAFGFESFDGHLRLPRSEAPEAADVLVAGGVNRTRVSLTRLVAELHRARAPVTRTITER